MADLPLTKIFETTKVITLGWTPVPCIGYVFYTNGTRVSNTWDASMSQTRFYKVPNGVYKVVAVGVNATGTYPAGVAPTSEAYSAEPYNTGVYSK
jgi:hypothetical protein